MLTSKHSAKRIGTFPIVNDMPWLKKLWVVIAFLFLCGPGPFAILVGEVHITLFRIMIPLYLYLFLLTLFVYQGRMEFRNKVGMYLLFLILWFLWAVFSLFWVPSVYDATRHIVLLLSLVLMTLFSLLFLTRVEDMRHFYHLWVVLAIVLVGIGIWEYTTGMHLPISRETEYIGIRATFPTGLFGNPNDFATALSLSFPFLYVMVAYSRRNLVKVLGVILILASFYLIVLNRSGANIIAFLIGICLVFLLARHKLKFLGVAVIVLVLVAFLSYAFPLSDDALSFHETIHNASQEITRIDPGNTSTLTRINLIRNGLAFLSDSYFLGIGAGNFEYYMLNEELLYYSWGHSNAHNWWLESLVDYGVLIFALLLAFYIGLLRNLLRVSRNSRNQTLKIVSLATFIALVQFSVAGLSASASFGIGRPFIWFLFASALSIINCYRIREREP